MPNPNANYDNIRRGGPDGLREPMEIQHATYEVYKELDLGSVSGTVVLTPDQAGASLITMTPSAAVTLVYPTCQPGFSALIQNLSASFTITAEVNGNTTNTAVCAVSVTTLIYHTGLNGGIKAQSAA